MAYNISGFVNNSDTVPNMITQINDASSGFFIGGLLVTIFLLMFIALKIYDTKVAMITSSMISTFFTITAWWAGWIAFPFIFIPIVVLLLSLLWSALGE